MDPHSPLRDRAKRDPRIMGLIHQVLDKRDATGKFPRSATLQCRDVADVEAARDLFSHDCVRQHPEDPVRVRVNIAKWSERLGDRHGTDVERVLDEVAQRRPKNHREARENSRAALLDHVSAASPGTPIAQAFQEQCLKILEKPMNRWLRLAEEAGVDEAANTILLAAQLIEAIEKNGTTVRLANFSQRQTGRAKIFAPGTKLYQLVTDALFEHDPMADATYKAASVDPAARRALLLESYGIYRNETTIQTLCYGRLLLNVEGVELDHISRLTDLGRPSSLLLAHLRDATLKANLRRVILIENETTFNDAVDAVAGRAEGIVLVSSRGQANSATLRLVELLHDAAPEATFHHWGDMDPYGVQILHSLQQRTRLVVEPLMMDAATFRRFESEAFEMPKEHRELLTRQQATGMRVCPDLLDIMHLTERVIEQEAIAGAVTEELVAFASREANED